MSFASHIDLGRIRRIGATLAVSGLSQGLSSLTNLSIALYLVRAMDKEQFGFYGLGFAVMLLIAHLVTAAISVQYVVNLPDVTGASRAHFALGHLGAVSALSLFLLIAAASASLIASSFRSVHPLGVLLLPVALAASANALRDMVLLVAYSERREGIVLQSNVAAALGTFCAFSAYAALGVELSASVSLLAYASGQFAGCAHGAVCLNLPWRKGRLLDVRQAFFESWKGGRWSIVTSIVYALRTHCHTFIIAPLLGMSVLAEMNAARVLVTPAVMAIAPVTQVLMPRLAEWRKNSRATLARAAVLITCGLTLIAAIYSLVLLICLPWLLPLALGDAYLSVGGLVKAWCAVTVLLALRNGLTIVLQVLRAFKELMLVNLAAAVLAMGVAVLVLENHGGEGVIYALALAELALCTGLLILAVGLIREGVIAERAVN